MGADITDLEADFRPMANSANWLGNNPGSSRAATYGFENRAQGTFSDAYGAPKGFYPDAASPDWVHHYSSNQAIPYGAQGYTQPVYSDSHGAPVTKFGAVDETVPYGYDGKTVPVYHNAYGSPLGWVSANPLLSVIISLAAGAVVGHLIVKKFL